MGAPDMPAPAEPFEAVARNVKMDKVFYLGEMEVSQVFEQTYETQPQSLSKSFFTRGRG